ncbi:hypothetical protein TB2_007484 [Malus domestica]
MGKDRNGSVSEGRSRSSEKEERRSRSCEKAEETERKSEKAREISDSESEEDRRRRLRRRYSSEEDTDSESESESEESGSDSESECDSGSESDGDRRRKRRKRREKDDDRERKRRKREKEKGRKRRRREKEEERKKKEKRKKKRKEKKEKGKAGVVTNSWGKYGIIRETDMWNKRSEFTAWLQEVKQVNLEHLANWEEKQMFKQFMEDHNTATFPSKKYYSLDNYYRNKMEKEIKRGFKKVAPTECIVFNDEEQKRQEMMRMCEKQKEEVEALKRSMQSGLVQAMKEQAQLREETAYQYQIGNMEAATAIQRRLDPDAAV